ncbi:MAG TPA: DUF2946 family protein [Burkholderiales bacterium]|nr:DUF2946 family protein [Burkholderiales bacterium]
MSARLHGVARWLPILAIALQALWPLLAQAKPRSVALVPICTVGGETHYLELETGGPAPHEEHCKACPVGAAALASCVRAFSSPEIAFRVPAGEDHPADRRFISHARPRAPPFSRSVEVISDNHSGRKDAQAIAVRHRDPARVAAAGRGVLRRGVLLD